MSSPLSPLDDPSALRRLDVQLLPAVCDELRAFVLSTVADTGGHLASSLGAVELTVALHYVFDTPRDRIVWDVGHQAYAHKALTGRRGPLLALRAAGGASGFPRRLESPYDAFGTAHSSTSVSAALGMAVAAQRQDAMRRVVAVIGDGGLSAGLAYEALNNAAAAGVDLLVVLNDNGMSISPSVGALERHLATLRREFAAARPGGAPVPTLFDDLGVRYAGPVDGHDVRALVEALRRERPVHGVRLLHVVTRKGKGYAPAEADPVLYHGVSRFDPAAGIAAKAGGSSTYAKVFGDWACDAAARDPRVVCVTPAMSEGSELTRFAREHPARFFDVGIAEQHAVTFAAGLACEGMKPIVAIYSTFLQRGYDQVIHDVALQGLPVLIAIDRAGVVGADGASHTGAYDIAYLRCVPGMTLMTPSDARELQAMLDLGLALDGPAAVRYPRGAAARALFADAPVGLALGRGIVRRRARQGEDAVAVLAFGPLLAEAMRAGERLDATVADMRFVKPLDRALVEMLARQHAALVTVEEHATAGGAGSAVAEALADADVSVPLVRLGLPDRFLEHGEPAAILRSCGLDADGIVSAVEAHLRRHRRPEPVPHA